MRYRVIPYDGDRREIKPLEARKWVIWDNQMSPKLRRMGLPPYCGVDGKQFIFGDPNAGWDWLEKCRLAGLDMGAPGMSVAVYHKPEGSNVAELRCEYRTTGHAPLHTTR